LHASAPRNPGLTRPLRAAHTLRIPSAFAPRASRPCPGRSGGDFVVTQRPPLAATRRGPGLPAMAHRSGRRGCAYAPQTNNTNDVNVVAKVFESGTTAGTTACRAALEALASPQEETSSNKQGRRKQTGCDSRRPLRRSQMCPRIKRGVCVRRGQCPGDANAIGAVGHAVGSALRGRATAPCAPCPATGSTSPATTSGRAPPRGSVRIGTDGNSRAWRLGHQPSCDCGNAHNDDEELESQGEMAIWFHAVNSHKQRGGNDPDAEDVNETRHSDIPVAPPSPLTQLGGAPRRPSSEGCRGRVQAQASAASGVGAVVVTSVVKKRAHSLRERDRRGLAKERKYEQEFL
jgi:hypothetical protein